MKSYTMVALQRDETDEMDEMDKTRPYEIARDRYFETVLESFFIGNAKNYN